MTDPNTLMPLMLFLKQIWCLTIKHRTIYEPPCEATYLLILNLGIR